MTASEFFGLWQQANYGWCGFKTTFHPDHIGYGYAGTRDEAENGRQEFINDGREPESYVVMPFDHEKEPPAIEAVPTPTQLEWLSSIKRYGRYPHPMHASWRQTSDRLQKNGWMITNLTAEGQEQARGPMIRLTQAGERALLRGVKEKVSP